MKLKRNLRLSLIFGRRKIENALSKRRLIDIKRYLRELKKSGDSNVKKELSSAIRAVRWISVLLFANALFVSLETCGGAPNANLREERIKTSKNWRDGSFVNPEPLVNDLWGSLASLFSKSEFASPSEPVPVEIPDPNSFLTPPASGLRVTWFGHSSTLVEIDGYRILTDPIWSERSSPFSWIGPKRWYAPLVSFDELPPVDAVVVSHDHYDHLDKKTILLLNDKDTRFIVPLGVGAHLEDWGIPKSKITELDWWESASFGKFKIVCTPARHASGRTLTDKDEHLWAGYALIGAEHRVYYSGGTGLFPAMRDIGTKYGPFDLTMIEIGQYNQAWPDWHIGPEQAVIAHKLVNGKKMLPVHWALFELAAHSWTEPIERVLSKSEELNVNVAIPRPGQSFEPEKETGFSRWWPSLPWKKESEDPIVSTQTEKLKSNRELQR